MSLTPIQQQVYLAHGEDLRQGRLKVKPLARELGVTEWTVRVAKAYAQNHPRVPEASAPQVARADAIHLVIGDAHAKPDTCQERFRWLGCVVRELYLEAQAKGAAPGLAAHVGSPSKHM